MDRVAAVLAFSIFVGGVSGYVFTNDVSIPDIRQHLTEEEEPEQEQRRFLLGSAHEHALFYVSVDGENLTFLEDRYQLAASYVHLENNRSHIVHKHAENVTWRDFAKTIDMNASRNGSEVCLDVKNVSRCGRGAIQLNGENVSSLESEIEQGDRLFLALGSGWRKALEELSGTELPEAYEPKPGRGRRV